MCQERYEYKKAYASYWAEMDCRSASGRPVDGVIMPVAATSAARKGEFSYLAYSAIANVLDLPAFVFPVRRSDPLVFNSKVDRGQPDERQGVPAGTCK